MPRAARSFLKAPLALVLALSLAASPALAQPAPDPAKLEEAKKHFGEGRTKYDAGDKEGAVEAFKTAYKLSRNPLLLYNVGFVYDELKDRPLAIHYYGKFLSDVAETEATKANRDLATERLKVLKREEADAEAGAAAGGGGGGGAGKVTPDEKRPRTAADFKHELVEEAPPGKPVDIVAVVPEDANWTLTLYYRGAGDDEFRTTPMRQRYTEMVGRIPANKVSGSFVQYWIEVKDAGGNVVTTSGKATSPTIIYLDPEAKPRFYKELGEGMKGGTPTGDETVTYAPPKGGEGDDPGRAEPRDHGDWFTYAKWGTTGGAVVFLGAAALFSVTASNWGSALEDEAEDSQGATCSNGATPPCTSFSGLQKDLESGGEMYETLTNVSLVLGVASAIGAGYFWYVDLKDGRRRPSPREAAARPRLLAAPMVGEGLVGGAALITF